MLKELKYFFYITTIFISLFLILNFYFSDDNKKNFYRSLKTINEQITIYAENLVLLNNDTKDAAIFIKRKIDKNKKNYHFWKLTAND